MSGGSQRREVEFKLRADGAAVSTADVARIAGELGLALREAPKVDQTDTYLDDAAFHLTRSGVGLRIREAARRRVLCVKLERGSKRGAFERDEVEVALNGETPRRPHQLPESVRDRVEPFAHDARLRPITVLRTRRRRMRGAGMEVAIDDVRVRDRDGQQIGRFAEVEIEVLDNGNRGDARRLADALAAELELQASSENKLQRALALQHVAPADGGPQPVGPDVPIAEAARRILLRHFRRMQREEVCVRTGDGTAGVHKLRVACRRMRAALRTFRPWLPERERKEFRALLRATATAFGSVRDFDVLAAELTAKSDRVPEHLGKSAARIVARLRTKSAAAREAGRTALRGTRRVRKVARLQRFLEQEHSAAGTPSVREIAPTLIRDAAEAAFAHGRSLGPGSPPDAIHELRILLKRLRYTAECFLDAYGKDLVRFVERTAHLQEILGEFNDAAVAVESLQRLVDEDRALKRRELLAAGALMAVEHQRGAEARRRFDQVWSEFDSADLRTWLVAVLRSPTGG